MKHLILRGCEKLYTFALGNKCKIYESDRYITMSQQKGENGLYLVV